MREIIHTDEDGRPLEPTAIDDCMLDNLNAPVIRSGAEPFKSYYAVEYGFYCYSAIDPSRSFVETSALIVTICLELIWWRFGHFFRKAFLISCLCRI